MSGQSNGASLTIVELKYIGLQSPLTCEFIQCIKIYSSKHGFNNVHSLGRQRQKSRGQSIGPCGIHTHVFVSCTTWIGSHITNTRYGENNCNYMSHYFFLMICIFSSLLIWRRNLPKTTFFSARLNSPTTTCTLYEYASMHK